MDDNDLAEVDHERCVWWGTYIFACAPEALRLEKRDDRILIPALDAHELFVMYGASKDRPESHHRPRV